MLLGIAVVWNILLAPALQQPGAPQLRRTPHERGKELVGMVHILHRHPAQAVVKGAAVIYVKDRLAQLARVHLTQSLVALDRDAGLAPLLQEGVALAVGIDIARLFAGWRRPGS